MDTTPQVPSRKRKTMQGRSLESPIGCINPMRRSSISLVTSTPVVFRTNDDDAERRNWKNLSTLQNEPESGKRSELIPLNTLEEFLGNWVRMSVENKINAKNVWKIHIIDYLRILLDKNTENPLQLATASLTASAKVYSLRVDDVYTEVIRLAGNLGHRGNENIEHEVNENGAGNQDNGNNEGAEDSSQRIRIRKKKVGRTKTITNPEALFGDVDLLDTVHPIFAELNTRSGDIIGTDNMFQVFTPLNSQISEYDIRLHEKFFDCETIKRTDPAAMELGEDIKKIILPFTLQSLDTIDNLKICSTFSEFSLINWSPDEEEAIYSQQNQCSVPSTTDQINLAFDINAEPQSIMDVTMEEAGGILENDSSDEEVVQEANTEPNLPTAHAAGCKPQIENIVDMRPSQHPNHTRNLEYSYNSIVNGVWAGPAHWKIKCIVHRSQPRMTVQHTAAEANTKKRVSKIKIIEMSFEEMYKEDEERQPRIIKSFLKCSDNKLRFATISTWNKHTNQLPIDLHINCADTLKLFLNKSWSLVRQKRPASILSIENNQYDYNNLNDSAFCNPPEPELLEKSNDIEHDYSDHEIDNDDNMFTGVEHGEAVDVMLTGDNLLPAPRIIPKLFVPYSTRAKKVNMRAIKQSMWDIITKTTDDQNDENVNNLNIELNKKVATETKFSLIIEKLPGLLPRDQAANISVALAFFGLLHLANENSLKLIGNDELTDITINKG